MSKFISGKAIIEDQDIKPFEFFENYIKKGLQPYDRDVGKPIPPPDVMQKRLRLKEAKNVLRNLEEKLVELRLHPEQIKKRMTLSQALKGFGHPIEEKTEGEIKKTKGEINTLIKELSTIKDDSWINYDLPVSATETKNILDDIVSYLYKVKEHPELLTLESTRSAEQKKAILFCEPGTKWENITITLIADDMVRVKTPQDEGRFTYHELGLSDKRKGDKPKMIWELLKLFAEKNGFIFSQNVKYDSKLPDTAKRLNAHLKKLFGIQDSIYKAHYKKEKGYRTKIEFSDARQSQNISKSAVGDNFTQDVKEIFEESNLTMNQIGTSQKKRYQQD